MLIQINKNCIVNTDSIQCILTDSAERHKIFFISGEMPYVVYTGTLDTLIQLLQPSRAATEAPGTP